jgi:hypothetical protein
MSIAAVSPSPIAASARAGGAKADAAATTAAPTPAPTRLIGATAPQQPPIPPRLYIELDEAADRFVQTVVDPANETVLRRFPEEGRLAFSRGVNAYVHAMRGR